MTMTTTRLTDRGGWDNIKIVYYLVLKHGYYVSNFHDKFNPEYFCVLVRNHDDTEKFVIRIK
jgi:hypothetical protein